MKKNYHEVVEGTVSRGTGAKKEKFRDKRKAHAGDYPALTRLGTKKVKRKRVRGGNVKVKLLSDEYVNVFIPEEKKAVKLKILRVVESNTPLFTRSNIIVKGAVLETERGLVKVTNRPGQEGCINGVLIKK